MKDLTFLGKNKFGTTKQMNITGNNTPPPKPNLWKDLREEIQLNINGPWKDPTFVIYFFAFIVTIGGFGIWIEVYKNIATSNNDISSLMKSLLTFSLALSSATLADLFLHDPSNREYGRPISKNGRFVFQAAGLLLMGSNCLLLFADVSWTHMITSWLVTFLTLLLWWNTNSYNPRLANIDANLALGSKEGVSDRPTGNHYKY